MEKCLDPGRHPWIFNRSGFRLAFSGLDSGAGHADTGGVINRLPME